MSARRGGGSSWRCGKRGGRGMVDGCGIDEVVARLDGDDGGEVSAVGWEWRGLLDT